MERMRLGVLILLVTVLFSGCSIDSDNPVPKLLAVSYFENDSEGWIAEFAEYHEGLEDSMKFSFDYGSVNIPNEIGDLTAIVQEGYATNSKLFMFVKQQVSGLIPNSRYMVVFNIEFNAQMLEEYSGVLDSLYLGSYLKAGVFKNEPVTEVVPDPENQDLNLVVTDFDIGDAAHETGTDMINLGLIEHTRVGESPIVLLGDNLDDPMDVTTDSEGKVWLAVGIDSNVPIYQAINYSTVITEFEFVTTY